ncbi:MAG: DEAD/DEAH box helicase [Oscillospiraceae bacterium]|jgi:hypothetical protein|nr:DEAD/DEAH box helicase [Oscillospiraceae bacterium]
MVASLDISELSVQELSDLARECVERLHSMLDTVIYKPSGTGYITWAKIVTGVDPRKLNGFCALGTPIPVFKASLVPKDAVILECDYMKELAIFRAVGDEKKEPLGTAKGWLKAQKILRAALYGNYVYNEPEVEDPQTQEAHQRAAFAKLAALDYGALFMRMGSGKTKVALDLCAHKLENCGADLVLYICPCAILDDFERERKRWRPDMEVAAYGVESLTQSDRVYLKILRLLEGKRAVCVVDESLTIKNWNKKRTPRVQEIGRQSTFRYILNGTPISRGARDLYNQILFLSPQILDMEWREFSHNYIIWDGEEGRRYIKGYKNLEHLTGLIAPYSYECDLVLDVRKSYEILRYDNDFDSEYRKIKEEILARMEYSDIDFWELCTRLQVCYTKSAGRPEAVNAALESRPGKALVFVKYLDGIPEGAARITGSETRKQRDETLADFRENDEKALWLTYGTGAKGLNLQFCSHVIFADQTFDYAQKIHAEHRIFRTGQAADELHFTDILCKCGMEEIFVRNIEKKGGLLAEINRNLRGKEASIKWVKSL